MSRPTGVLMVGSPAIIDPWADGEDLAGGSSRRDDRLRSSALAGPRSGILRT